VKLNARAEADLRGHLPRLLVRARALLKLQGGDEFSLGKSELKRAVTFVSELHQGLVGERTLAQACTYDRPSLLGAYLLWWWPQSYARARAAIDLVPGVMPFLLEKKSAPIRILDLGAGPGPAAIAAADWLTGQGFKVDATLLDQSEPALLEAKALAQNRPNLTLHTERKDLSKPLQLAGQYDLILAANILLELPGKAPERAAFLQAICDANLSPKGTLLVFEPALRETGRALLEVRDLLIGAASPDRASPPPGRLRALAPCLTQQACPALIHPRDWCTSEIAWSGPPHVLQLSRELGLHAEAPLSFAPMILSRTVPAPPEDLWRVVGVPPIEKGKKRLFVCADRGRLPVVRLDRDETEATRGFDEAARGDLIVLQGLLEKGDGLRLATGATAELQK
jgi:SAM-dependent methyltransferase